MRNRRYSSYVLQQYGVAFAELAGPEWAEDVSMSTRLYNCLKAMTGMGMDTSAGALRQATDKQLMCAKNMGRATVRELRKVLSEIGKES